MTTKKTPETPATPTPQVSDLLARCIVKISEMVHKDDVSPKELDSCVSMLIQIDRNDREIRAALSKGVPMLDDDEFDENLISYGMPPMPKE